MVKHKSKMSKISGIDFVHKNENQYQDFPKKHAQVRFARNYTETVVLPKIPTPGY